MLDALADRVDVSSSTVRMWSSTTMARSTVKPLVSATSVFGRMPAATTTRSQSISVSSRSRTPRTFWSAPDGRGSVVGDDADAEPGHAAPQTSPPLAPELGVHQVPAARVDDVTSMPWLCRPRAASRPSRPPPITTAL